MLTVLKTSPAKLRFVDRRQLLGFERFDLDLQSSKGRKYRLRVLEITSFGCSVEATKMGPLPAVGETFYDVDILFHGKKVGSYPSARVTRAQAGQCGLTFSSTSDRDKESPRAKARATHRVVLDSLYAPSAWCIHPLQFDTFVYFRLADISVGGARLVCSARNRMLFRGAKLEGLKLLLPNVGEVEVAATVLNIDRSPEDNALLLSVAFTASAKARRDIARFALTFASNGDKLMQQLKDMGTPLKSVKDVVNFGYVRDDADYLAVLELRRTAYVRAAKVPDSVRTADMQDRFDKNSVIVWARSGSRIVGSVRVTYCEEAEDRFELDDSGVVPSYLPRRDTIEVSRLCVSDEFEGSNLVLGLIERAVEIGLNRRVKWVITSATDEKVRYYKNIGFTTPGISFDLATLHGVPHHLLILDVASVTHAHKMNPVYWMFTFGRVVKHLSKFGVVADYKMSTWQSALVWATQHLLAWQSKRRMARTPDQ